VGARDKRLLSAKGAFCLTNTEKRIRFIDLFSQFVQQAKAKGIQFIVWTFHRTAQEQNYLYQQGRTRSGRKVTNCDGYIKASNHQNWLAKDILIIKDGHDVWTRTPDYDRLGEIWTALGGRWGGEWDDCFHFEL